MPKGVVQGRDKVMLHHIVFGKVGTPDATCGGAAERFYAEGEERLAFDLPNGYGYPNKGSDRWYLLYMLMNHKPKALDGYVRYTVQYATGEQLAPVKPIWLDVRNCKGLDPSYDVPGTSQALLCLGRDDVLGLASERQARRGRRPPARWWDSPRPRQLDVRQETLQLGAHLGWPGAEAHPPRARADEDVAVPLERGHPRGGRATPHA